MNEVRILAVPICCDRKEVEATFNGEFNTYDEFLKEVDKFVAEHIKEFEDEGYDPESVISYSVSEIVDMMNDDAVFVDNYWYVDAYIKN